MYQVRTHLVKYQVPTYHLTLTLTLPYPNQAGTLSGNPLAMRAGIETMKILSQPGQVRGRARGRVRVSLVEQWHEALRP